MRISDWSSDVCSSDLDRRDAFRRAQRELLRHQFARDQREIGGEADDDREARGARGLDVEPEPRPQPLGDRLAQAGTRIGARSEEHTSELQSLMRISYAVFCLKKKNKKLQKE